MKEIKKMIPRIISAVDLTNLQPGERIGLIGNENMRSRREFLEKLLKTGIVVGLPSIIFSSCEPEILYITTDEEDCPAFTPATGNIPCACNTDAMATVPPKVVNTIPANNSSLVNDTAGFEIRLDIDKAIDISSVAGAVTLTPQPAGGFDVHFYDLTKINTGYKTSLSLCKVGTSNKLILADDTNYTVTLKGTVKDTNGKFLDGNGDGTGGDDFTYSFTTLKKYDSCICQADCSCVGNTCSCQSDSSCYCVGQSCYYCSCANMGCITWRTK